MRIGPDVEIGANTTIDRGAIEDTVIEDGVKLDNQIQIGHNVRIGAHTAIAGCTGISGSTVIGERCLIGGACAIGGHLVISDDTCHHRLLMSAIRFQARRILQRHTVREAADLAPDGGAVQTPRPVRGPTRRTSNGPHRHGGRTRARK